MSARTTNACRCPLCVHTGKIGCACIVQAWPHYHALHMHERLALHVCSCLPCVQYHQFDPSLAQVQAHHRSRDLGYGWIVPGQDDLQSLSSMPLAGCTSQIVLTFWARGALLYLPPNSWPLVLPLGRRTEPLDHMAPAARAAMGNMPLPFERTANGTAARGRLGLYTLAC